jgi:hypothetical protein
MNLLFGIYMEMKNYFHSLKNKSSSLNSEPWDRREVIQSFSLIIADKYCSLIFAE